MNRESPTPAETSGARPSPRSSAHQGSGLRDQRWSETAATLGVWRTGAVGALMAAIAGLCFLVVPLFQGPVHLSYDLPFYFHPRTTVDGVVIVYMDSDSEARLGQGRWDRWDRAVHARLIRKLTEAGAKAVVFDVRFRPNATNNPVDHELAEAAKAHGRVAVAAMTEARVHEGEVIGLDLGKPYDELAAVAKWGMAEASDANKVIRQHSRDTVFQVPSLAWRAAELTVATNELPDPFAERWVNYYGPGGYLPHISYADILETSFDAATVVSNKVVFVGALWSVGFTGGKGTDDFRTPHTLWTGRKSPGVEIQATTYLNIVRRDWLTRLPPLTEAGVILLFAAIVGFGLASPRPTQAFCLSVAGAIVVVAVAIVVMWGTKVWFPWLVVVAIQIPCALTWSVLASTRQLHREKRVLEQTLAMVRSGESPTADKQLEPRARIATAPPGQPPVETPRPDRAPAADAPATIPDHELVRRIGRGAYGEVWLARDVIGTYHAVKIVFRNAFKEAGPFEREFNGIRRFTPISRTHPGFVHVLHVGRNDREGYLYYVMELGDDERRGQEIDPGSYAAKTLTSELQRRRIPTNECLAIAMHLAEALQYLHSKQLVHRDIKPANIIFVRDTPKFADIGLVTEAAADSRDATYLGTKGYIAPEGPGTPAADVFALGKVIYEMAFGLEVGRYPELPTSVVENTDPVLLELNRIVMKACAQNVEQRFQSAAELQAALDALRRNVLRGT
jgi:CHASE2 domain-containing sensor protein